MRSTRTVFKIKCDRCGKEVEYGNGEIQDKTKGWLLITISTATNVDDKERDICPACALISLPILLEVAVLPLTEA